MQPTTKLVCEGTAARPHDPRTVAYFRHEDDGWARVYPEERAGHREPLLFEPTGEVTMRHSIKCDWCSYDGYFKPEKLYPMLDRARARGWMPVPR
ncbi:hypothetical protein M1D46_00535 [Microbacterium sp. JZ70]